VAPVREFFDHVAGQRELWNALARAGKLHDFLDLAQGHFARGIEERLAARPLARSRVSSEDLRARSHALAGALLALLSWWLREGTPGSPERMDAVFHGMVQNGVDSVATARSLRS